MVHVAIHMVDMQAYAGRYFVIVRPGFGEKFNEDTLFGIDDVVLVARASAVF